MAGRSLAGRDTQGQAVEAELESLIPGIRGVRVDALAYHRDRVGVAPGLAHALDVLRRHETRLAGGDRILVPAPAAAQVVRDPRRQARLMLTLRTCDVVPFGADDVAPVGRLLAGAGTADVIDGFVALTAAQVGGAVVTPDGHDIRHLLKTLGVRLAVFAP